MLLVCSHWLSVIELHAAHEIHNEKIIVHNVLSSGRIASICRRKGHCNLVNILYISLVALSIQLYTVVQLTMILWQSSYLPTKRRPSVNVNPNYYLHHPSKYTSMTQPLSTNWRSQHIILLLIHSLHAHNQRNTLGLLLASSKCNKNNKQIDLNKKFILISIYSPLHFLPCPCMPHSSYFSNTSVSANSFSSLYPTSLLHRTLLAQLCLHTYTTLDTGTILYFSKIFQNYFTYLYLFIVIFDMAFTLSFCEHKK